MTEALRMLPALLGAHLQLTLVALGVALAVSLPVGAWLSRSPRLRGPALTLAGVLQTLPSIALLALMVPAFVLVRQATAVLGLDTPVLGFLPAVAALSLYGILPILRNTVTGLVEVDPQLVEAARGLGMTEGQVLTRVQLPLAAPVVFAGVRTAAVWVVGTATLATPVGQRCLGDLIFGGLQTRQWDAVLLGCLAAAALAIVLDGILGAMERARSSRARAWTGGVGAGAMILLAAGPAAADALSSDGPRVVIGAKGFTEQFILARLVKIRLERAGYDTTLREGLGSTIAFDALGDGGLDVSIDYSGTIWANHMRRTDTASPEVVNATIGPWVKEHRGATLLGSLGFENTYAIAVRRSDAARHGWTTVADLGPASPGLTLGGDYEFFQRSEWTALNRSYPLHFGEQRTFDPTFLYDALRAGEVDAISAYSTDGRIEAFDLLTLDDPKQALPPYDALLLLGGTVSEDPGVVEALAPLVGGVDLQAMRRANHMVDGDGRSPMDAAVWLDRQVSRADPGTDGG